MAELTFVLNHRRGWAVDPRTVAALCVGIADLCRYQDVIVRGERVEVRAKVVRVRPGSIKFLFDLQPLLENQAVAGFGLGVASSIAASMILDALKWLHSKSAHGRRARAQELADSLKSPAVAGALRELFSSLHQDEAISSVKIEAEGKSIKFDAAQIERAEDVLAASEWGMARDEEVLWGKHVRIVATAGQPPSEEWKVHWDDDDQSQEVWVRAPRIPSERSWRPGRDRTLVVDIRIRRRVGGRYREVESADVLNVHWTQME